jgi:hypothetical protein
MMKPSPSIPPAVSADPLNSGAGGKRPQTFTYHWYPKAIAAGAAVLFGIGLAASLYSWAFHGDDPVTAAFFFLLLIPSLAFFFWLDRRWTVGEAGISFRSWNRRERLLEWEDMDSVSGTGLGDGIRIRHRSGKTLLTLNPWIGRYGDFVELLRIHKGELFRRDTRDLSGSSLEGLRRNPVLLPFGLFLSLGFILVGVAILITGEWPAAIFILIGGYILYGLFIVPTAVHLRDDSLELDYLRGKKIIPASGIRKVYASAYHSYRGNAQASAIIELTNGKRIELSGYRDGTPVVVNALQYWLELSRPTQPGA